MKILHVGKYFSPFSGGLENYMRDAMVALARRGIKTAALVHKHSLSFKTSDETYTASGHQFHIVRTGMWARLLYTPISPAFPWQLRKFIKSFRPDVLHLHMPNPSVFWVLAMPSARRIPWVVHWHADVITSAQDWRMKLFYKLYQPFERAVLKRAKRIVATSVPYRDSSQPLQEWLDKCKVVPLGVDVERFGSAIGSQDDKPALQILAVGRLTYYKGFRYLIEAAAQLSRANGPRVEPGVTGDQAPGIHINLVGHGDEAEQLKALVASLKLQDRVTFHGILSNDELAQQMADCDCLCLPSIERTEAFGMVLLEAMYFGKATVISDVEGSGMGWVVDDGITGIKVRPADAGALATAFKRLAADRNELAKMGRWGKEKFDQQFEINHAVEGLIKIYQQATQTTPGDSSSRA